MNRYLGLSLFCLTGCLYWPALIEEKRPPFAPEDCAGTIFTRSIPLIDAGSCAYTAIADDSTWGSGYLLTVGTPSVEEVGAYLKVRMEVDGLGQCLVVGEVSERWEFKPVANGYATYFNDGACATECVPTLASQLEVPLTFCDEKGDSIFAAALAEADSAPPDGPSWRFAGPLESWVGTIAVQEWGRKGDRACFALAWEPTGGRASYGFAIARGGLDDLVVEQTVGLAGIGVGWSLSRRSDGRAQVVAGPEAVSSPLLGGAERWVLTPGADRRAPVWPAGFGALARVACAGL